MKITSETFDAKDGDKTIRGMIYRPDETGVKRPVVIFSHGYGWAYPYMKSTAKKFARKGIAFVLFDFCGGAPDSSSDGDTREMSVLTEVSNLNVIISKVRRMSFVDPTNVFLLGESQGGLVSALVASKRPHDIRGLILKYAAFSIADDAKKKIDTEYGGNASEMPDSIMFMGMAVGRKYFTDVAYMPVYENIRGYKGPVFIAHGKVDKLVPVEYAERAARIYKKATLKEYLIAGHGFYGFVSLRFERAALKFVKDNIRTKE